MNKSLCLFLFLAVALVCVHATGEAKPEDTSKPEGAAEGEHGAEGEHTPASESESEPSSEGEAESEAEAKSEGDKGGVTSLVSTVFVVLPALLVASSLWFRPLKLYSKRNFYIFLFTLSLNIWFVTDITLAECATLVQKYTKMKIIF